MYGSEYTVSIGVAASGYLCGQGGGRFELLIDKLKLLIDKLNQL